MLEITPDKIAHVILMSREIDAKVGRWDQPGEAADADTILEARAGDATDQELRAFIDSLNADECAGLVAVMWIGRETYLPEDLEEALDTARLEAQTSTADYLLGTPLVSEHLADGLDKLGINPDSIEEGFY